VTKRMPIDEFRDALARKALSRREVVATLATVGVATVSMPLRWREVNARLRLDRFTIRTMPARLARMKDDPLLGVLDETPDLPAALGRLAARLADS